MTFKGFLQLFAGFAVVLSLIPLIAADYWWIRMFDFPHIQLTALTLTAIIAYLMKFDIKWVNDYIFMSVMIACFAFQMTKIVPYLPHNQYELLASKKEKRTDTLTIYTANVYQKNSKKHLLVKDIEARDPDLIVLLETDSGWMDYVNTAILSSYPYTLLAPLDNTYGMLFYSKYPLENEEIRYLVEEDIPSMHGLVALPSGARFQFHLIHPTPPMPQHNPRSTDRDREMMLVADMARTTDLPVIVAGDFNDVAWSDTTTLFQKVSGLLDPRVGRGFYNTYSANNVLLRWPLDHLFVSEEFRLLSIELGDDIGSDHFPAVVSLSLEPEHAQEQTPEPPTEDELERAKEQMTSQEKMSM
ncbi:endonuclease/exonuclease/phosphatase family protein [Croceiramulus getboli]|nr:endonuclease/exonuclease/phosphatase family protein [Flavobacteriaceae bacterium YJPT1-3]